MAPANPHRSSTLPPPGSRATFRRMLLFGAALPILAILLMTAFLSLEIYQRTLDVDWTEHSDEVLKTASESLLYLTQMSSLVRDYVIRGDPVALAAYRQSSDRASGSLSALAFLVRDDPAQVDRINTISQLKGELIARYDEILEDRDHGGCARCLIQLAGSHQVMARIYHDFDQFDGVERTLRSRRAQRQADSERAIIAGLAALVIVVLFAAVYSIWHTLKRVAAIYDQALASAGTSRANAERANRAKDEFLSVVSHELRGPLSAISMWTQALLSGCTSEGPDHQKLRRGLEAIGRAIQSENEMINDLLDVSRIEAGKMRLDVRTVDLPSVIEAAAEIVRPSADARGIRLQLILDPSAGPVAGDPERLQQVFWNLLSNAVKFTPKEGRIEVKLERINSHLELTVSDSGRGIDATALAHIFEPFWQEQDGPSRSETGLGLGLSIVRKIVEMHGGSVIATSDGPMLGATFTVILPVALAHEPSTVLRQHPTAATASADGTARLDGLRVLAVDDQPDSIAAIQSLLQAHGAEVRTASSAYSALAQLDAWQPHVLVSDIGMPNQDGYFLIRELRSRPRERCGDLPAIALTAYGRVQDTVHLLESGFHMHVTKPVEPAELFAAIRSVTRTTAEFNK